MNYEEYKLMKKEDREYYNYTFGRLEDSAFAMLLAGGVIASVSYAVEGWDSYFLVAGGSALVVIYYYFEYKRKQWLRARGYIK